MELIDCANLSIWCSYKFESSQRVNECNFDFQECKAHANTDTGAPAKGQIGKLRTFGLRCICESARQGVGMIL